MTTTSATKENTTARKACTYKGAVLIRVYDKTSGALLGYAAKPSQPFNEDGTPKVWYGVTCNEETGEWTCTCKGNAEHHLICKHMRAAQELNEIRLGVCKVEEVVMAVEEVINLQAKLYSLNPDELKVELEGMKLVELKELAKDRHVKASGKKAACVEALLADYAESHAVDARIEALEASLKVAPMLSPEEHEELTVVPDDVHSEEIPFEENPFASVYRVAGELPVPELPLCVLCHKNPVADSSGYCSTDCAEQAELLLMEAESGLPELPEQEEEEIDTTPLSTEDAQLFEQVDNEEIVLQDELKSEPVAPAKELTKAQVIACIRDCVQQLVDFDDDYASEDNGIGPSGRDTEWMHNFAAQMQKRDAIITVERWLKAAKRLQKYNRTQLGGIVPPMAVIAKVLSTSSTEATMAVRGLMK